jgi:hypothetical protein
MGEWNSMNDRLLTLAKQSGLKKDHGTDREYVGDFDWREYGELIIRECINKVEEGCFYSGDEWDKSRISAVTDIKEHFGVNK